MVRGNWQKRVETAQARRKETRQRKLRRDSRASYKTLVQTQLWDFLDRNNDDIISYQSADRVNPSSTPVGTNRKDLDDISIHIWTDIVPNCFAIHSRTHDSPYQQSDQEILQSDDSFHGTSPVARNSQSKTHQSSLITPKSAKSRRHSFDETSPSPNMLNMSRLDIHAKDTPESRDKVGKRASKGRHNSFDEKYGQGRHNSFDETYLSVNVESSPGHSESQSRMAPVYDSPDGNNNELPDADNYLCRKFFFMDTCPHVSAKKSSRCTCLYEHYPKNSSQKSLAQVLHADTQVIQSHDASHTISQTLESSSQASAVALSELDDLIYDPDNDTGDGHIDMLYYISIPIRSMKERGKDDILSSPNSMNMNGAVDDNPIESAKVSRAISQVLSKEKCPIGSIVYLTIGNTLIFDRYKGGIVASSPTFSFTQSPMRSSIDLKPSPITRLPDSILEYIIMFLPNNASGILPSVCKLWYNEIGKNSPALWKSLIERNNWPSLCLNTGQDSNGDGTITTGLELRTQLRQLFISHYTIVQNMMSLFSEIRKIGAPSTHPIQRLHQKSCLTLSYSDRNEAYSSCVEVLPFSDSSLLVAYQNCTLRLFDVGLSFSGQVLKQSLLVRIAPFGISKKTSTSLRGVAMDDHTLLCSYSVHNAKRVDDPSSKCWLASIHREELRCMNSGSTQDEINEVVHVYNIWQRVSDYLPKIMDHAGDNFADYLISGGSTSDLHVKIGKELVSCGSGRFIFIALILDGPDDDENTTTLAAVSILFSTPGASIIWMEFLPPTLQPELSDHFSLCSMRGMNSKSTATVAVMSTHGSHILLIEVNTRNGVVLREISDDSHIHRNPEDVLAGLDNSTAKRCGLVLAHEIILADKSLLENTWQLSFLSYSEKTETTLCTLLIYDCLSIRRIQHVGDHVVAEANFFRMPHDPHGSFGFIIIHISSRREVHRYCLEEFDPVENSSRHRSLFTQNLSAFVLINCSDTEDTQVNVILSSSFIRNGDKVVEVDVDASKKKPKKSSQKNPKKDGYARGMSLRG